MAKNKLSKQQQRRIKSKQQRFADDQSSLSGVVIGQLGRRFDVEVDSELTQCAQRKHLGPIVCGDKVKIEINDAKEGVITAIEDRDSLLARPDSRGKMKAIAANIDRMFIVCAIKPELNEGLIDRYLVTAELLDITPVIVLNKIDLVNDSELNDIEKRLAIYHQLDYDIIYTSAKSQHGTDQLHKSLQQHTSILVGQSGVGKSSLLNQLLPDVEAKVGDVSISSNKGTHTTSASRLYHLPQGGRLIDSPGVREFGLWQVQAEQIADGFVEFQQYTNQCRFNDCKHENEPACAVLKAVEDGDISTMRFDSYRRIVASLLDDI